MSKKRPAQGTSSMALILLTLFLFSCAHKQVGFPDHWWQTINDEKAPDWEILPQAGERNKSVILSKRNELGILSNFAPTPFELDGKKYASLEGFWQSLKYPESKNDPRLTDKKIKWPLSRSQVEQMTAFEAKKAGDLASENMKQLKIDWVTYKNKKLVYREPVKGPFYNLILRAMKAKLAQNAEVQKTLLATENLDLLPDHKTSPKDPPAWKYYQIWMDLRNEMLVASEKKTKNK